MIRALIVPLYKRDNATCAACGARLKKEDIFRPLCGGMITKD